jgi:hypothetical protein
MNRFEVQYRRYRRDHLPYCSALSVSMRAWAHTKLIQQIVRMVT